MRFKIVLTGTADGLDDVTLRCNNLSMTLRESTSCYISAVVDPSHIEEINARPSGDLEVYAVVDSTETLLVTGNVQDLRTDSGGYSRSYTLVATTTASFTPFDTVSLYQSDLVTDRLLDDGRQSFQITFNTIVMPGDTARVYDDDGVTYTDYSIDQLQATANSRGAQITITEAAA